MTDPTRTLYTDKTEKSIQQKKLINIAIIGVGPRGAKLCERIFDHCQHLPSYSFHIFLFEPNNLGEGCHYSAQSKSLLMNTPASQLSIFESSYTKKFDEWVKSKKYNNERVSDTNNSEYYPRYIFGEYLSESFSALLKNSPKNVYLRHIKEAVIDIEKLSDDLWELSTSKKKYSKINYVHLTTGHGIQYSKETSKTHTLHHKLINCTYPIKPNIENICKDRVIAVEGLGLTSFDIIAELTEQRGGRFVTSDDNILKYIPSGKEPKIIAFSRSGLPLRAKPKTIDINNEPYSPKFLTSEKIKKLSVANSIDFEADVLPLIELEMNYIYSSVLLKNSSFSDKNSNNSFKFKDFSQPLSEHEKGSHQDYTKSLINHLRSDYLEADKGINQSPIKATENLLRDLREIISQLIDFKKLSGSSHSWLYQHFLPQMKQLSIGPPRIRIAQWLALIDAGILKIDLGPGATCLPKKDKWEITSRNWPDQKVTADFFIKGRIPTIQFESNALVRKMIKNGYATPFNNNGFKSGGIEVSRDFKILSNEGIENSTLWATGVLTEGARFYTFSLPNPGRPSRFNEDAETAVKSMFYHILKSIKITQETK